MPLSMNKNVNGQLMALLRWSDKLQSGKISLSQTSILKIKPGMLMSHGLRSLLLKTFPKNLISMYYSVAVINDSTFPEVKYL